MEQNRGIYTVIEARRIILPRGQEHEGPLYIIIKGDVIASIQTDPPEVSNAMLLKTHLLTPGFFDLHTHGLGGADDVTQFWSNPDYTLNKLPSQGTTSCLATIVLPKDIDNTQLFKALANTVGHTDRGAVLEGVYAEGPIVNDCGGLPKSDTEISLDNFERCLDSIPYLKLMTISPHLEAKCNYQRIKALLKRGVKPSLGHDRVATEDEILGTLALSSDPLHMTHIFNVSSFHHRCPSLVNFGLTSQYPLLPNYKDINPPTVEVIGDLAHVHPLTLSALIQARGSQDICFITDSVHQATCPGEFINYNNRKLVVSDDCKTMVLEGTSTIAGVTIPNAIRMLSENPARVAKLDNIGEIAVGKRADLLLFDDNHQLRQTLVAGQVVWNNDN